MPHYVRYSHDAARRPELSRQFSDAANFDHPGINAAVIAMPVTDRDRSRLRFAVALAAWTAASMVLIAASVSAQDGAMAKPKFEIVEPGEAFFEEKNLQRMEATVSQLGRGVSEIDSRIAGAYFTKTVPGIITNPDRSLEANELVRSLRKTMQRAEVRGDQAPVDKLNNYLFRSLGQIANGNYYPPARVMAISLIGELNSRPIDLKNQRPPEPYTPALGPLYRWATDENEVDGVRAAAMVGLERHLSLKPLSGNAAEAVGKSMQAILDAPSPPQRDPVAHAYLQRVAVDILRSLNGGEDKAFGARLVSISVDSQQPDLIALHSASALGKMPTPAISEAAQLAAPQAMLDAWSQRMLATLETELDRLIALNKRPVAPSQPRDPEEYLEKRKEIGDEANAANNFRDPNDVDDVEQDFGFPRQRSSFESMMLDDVDNFNDTLDGDFGGRRQMREIKPQPPEVIAARKKINYALQSLHAAATGDPVVGRTSDKLGVGAAVPADKKTLVTAWASELSIISERLNDRTLTEIPTFQNELQTQITDLQNKLNVGKQKMMGGNEPRGPLLAPLGGPIAEPMAKPAMNDGANELGVGLGDELGGP